MLSFYTCEMLDYKDGADLGEAAEFNTQCYGMSLSPASATIISLCKEHSFHDFKEIT